jgi:hypothetical protein
MDEPDAAGERLARTREHGRRSIEAHVAAIGMEAAGEDLEQRRFASAVFADDRVGFSAGDGKRHIVQRLDGAERLRDVAEFDSSQG